MYESCHRLTRQSGFGALAVMLLLLFATSIVVFYLNRGLIFEQKTSANQVRSTAAFEVAEAGLEWATGMLNTPTLVTPHCTMTTSFRQRYLGTGAVSPTPRTYPGCKIDGTTLTCACPSAAGAGAEAFANPNSDVLPSFTISFEDVGDPQAVRVTSTGCTAQSGMCRPNTALTPSGATTANSDAWAQVSVILKLRSLLRAAPSAPLTCGGACNVDGSYNIINTDVASNGYLVNSGSTITLQPGNGADYVTIPGQPLTNAMIANDETLTALTGVNGSGCADSTFFRAFFGTTIAEYRASPQVITINCGSGNCNTLVTNAYNAGWRSFYFPAANGVQLSNITLGAPGEGNGVNLVSDGDIQTSGRTTIYGLVYGNNASLDYNGTGGADIFGAMVACNLYDSNGNGTLTYVPSSLGGNGLRPGSMVRVPGSWRDFAP
jgi:PilX N-terminal